MFAACLTSRLTLHGPKTGPTVLRKEQVSDLPLSELFKGRVFPPRLAQTHNAP